MRADLSHLIKVLHAEKPPSRIWQKPFDYDPSHYKRLCKLDGRDPLGEDLLAYAHDMLYEKSPLQPDLFRYLLPIFLDVWYWNLLTNSRSGYGGIVEYFWEALAERTVLQHLSPHQYAEVETFMAAALLDRIDQESGLSFSSMGASPHTWFHALGSFCVAFAGLPALWKSWWEMTTSGQACAVLQYLSCLLYEDDRNPVFSVWTPEGGGGPPCLWETAGFIYEHGWRTENAAYLQATLTTAFVEDRLRYATQTVKYVAYSPVPQQMVEDFAAQAALLEKRLAELPSLLLASPMSDLEWSV